MQFNFKVDKMNNRFYLSQSIFKFKCKKFSQYVAHDNINFHRDYIEHEFLKQVKHVKMLNLKKIFFNEN